MTDKATQRASYDDLTLRYPTWPTMRRLLSEAAAAHIPSYIIAFLLMVVTAVCVGATAWVIKDIINEVFIARQRNMVLPISLAILAIFIVKGLSAYGSTVILARVSARVLAALKKRMIAKVLAQGMTFFDGQTTGEITARFNQNANAAREVITRVVAGGLRDVLTLIVLLGVMIYQDPLLSVLSVVIVPPALFVLNWIIRRIRRLAGEEFDALSRTMKLLTDTVRGISVIKTFNLESNRRAEMDAAIEEVEDRSLKVAKYNAITLPLADTLGGLGIAVVILYGGYAIIDRNGDAGTLFSFITAFLMAYEPATRLGRLNVLIQRNMVGVRLMYQLLDEPLSEPDATDAKPMAPGPGAISFSNVTFAYDAAPALDAFSLDVRPGEFMAIVGPSGSGKTTLFNLLMRFYVPSSGAIRIDGQDIAGVQVKDLRHAITSVGQHPFLFLGTIRDNIMMARPDASQADLMRAVRSACVDEFLDKLPGGLDADVGEAGARLSGGQRQRVAIARALLKDAPIVLFDEATSALDSDSEKQVQAAFEELRQNRTALVIAHRLSTLRNADRLAVLQAGRLIELGTHKELLAKPGVFSNLHEIQNS